MSEYRYYQPIEIRYSDLDPQGHVNNSYYLSYIEQARVGYLVQLDLWNGESFLDIGIILADAQITFKAPILFKQIIEVGVRVSRLGNKSLTMEYLIQDRISLVEHAHASTVIVTFDFQQRKSIEIPESWRLRIAEFEKLTQS